jgi:hypothetical protein
MGDSRDVQGDARAATWEFDIIIFLYWIIYWNQTIKILQKEHYISYNSYNLV